MAAKSKIFWPSVLFCFFPIAIGSSLAPQLARPTAVFDSGVVTAVYDGDTIKVQFSDGSSRRVRLIGVDTPELNDSREKVALWAHLAKRFSFFYLYGKKVRLTYDQTRLDQYGRTLAYIWRDEGELFNEFIIREGFAFAFLAFPFRADYQEHFREAQREACQGGKGLWHKGEPEVIFSAEARSHLGKYISIRFACSSVAEKRSFIYLTSSQQEFEVVIPRDRLAFFPAPKTYLAKDLVVSSFLEEFKGRPQMMIFFPRQLRLAAD